MKLIKSVNAVILVFLFMCERNLVCGDSATESFVVTSTESEKKAVDSSENDVFAVNPQIYSMQLFTNVSNRFAKTLITSKVRNLKQVAAETTFSVILPDNAFISEFEMEINGKIYKAYVKEKEEAKQIYQQAVSRGQSAAHVEMNARDSKTFTVSVNIEPEGKTIFRLIYEELLQRENGHYELILNIRPGQIIEDLGVQVQINESRPLTFVKTPSLRTGNEISKNDDKLDPSAKINIVNGTFATVAFSPDKEQQKSFAKYLGGDKENGLSGQFVVQYDVERDPHGGEVLVRDGYFVHFFAPTDLKPLPKHVVFVLDHSGSMSGRKIGQLVEAMKNILSELKTDDLFNIIRFADEASVWDIETNQFKAVTIMSPEYGRLGPQMKEMNLTLPPAVEASKENIDKAKNVIEDTSDLGMTNIIAGLEIGLFLINNRNQQTESKKYQPIIFFLTDGDGNIGISSRDQITNIITGLNTGANRAAIFSLSFGDDADKSFLQKLSSRNLGFSRHIYEAADSSLQLQDFYKTISSPLLSNVTFKYVDSVTQVTKTRPILFNGSEIVVAGRISDNPNILVILESVNGIAVNGKVTFNATNSQPVTSLERLWAYLTIKQILKERDIADNKTELTKKALDLALKYSFVTSVSSLVVVKPNMTDSIGTKPAHPTPPAPRWPARPMPSGRHYSRGDGGYSSGYSRGGSRGSGRTSSHSRPSYHSNILSGRSFHSRIPSAGMPGQSYYRPGAPSYHRPRPTGPSGVVLTTTRRPLPPPMFSTPTPSNNTTLPQWLENLKVNNGKITTPNGTYKLGNGGMATTQPECPKNPVDSSKGICTIIFDCPEVFPLLTNMTVYLNYFCPLDEFAGVCCPPKSSVVP